MNRRKLPTFNPLQAFNFTCEHKLGNGGNADPLLAYYEGQDKAGAIGFRAGISSKTEAIT